jgi:hypothetical protein
MQTFLQFITWRLCTAKHVSGVHHQKLHKCSSSLWFYLRSVLKAVLLVVVKPTSPTTTNSTVRAWQHPPTTRPANFHVWKTRGRQCSFRLLMMGGVLPQTCWALYKYGIIKFWYIVASCWIFHYEFDYDARIHERQWVVSVKFVLA